MNKTFSIIIPTIRGNHLVDSCLKSFKSYEPDSSLYEIIVIDDGSDLNTQKELQKICARYDATCVLRGQNEGYPRAANAGMEIARGDYLLLANNDIVFTQPILKRLKAIHEENRTIGVVGAKLLYKDGTIQHAGMTRMGNSHHFVHTFTDYAPESPEVNRSRFCIAVTGALFSISRDLYAKIGGFNRNYFLSCDDSEYCLRTWEAGYKVYYSHEIEAIHLEGKSRGRTHEEKFEKHPVWYAREKQTIERFHQDFKRFDIREIEKRVRLSNLRTRKLEIGSGFNPQPGYVHLDVRHELPEVDFVCDFSREPLPFDDNVFEEILSNHSIEHISWRKLPFVLSEWFRVLKPGGRVFLRTPDLEFICRTYLDGKTTPEWPGDEQFIRANLSPRITPAWWANIKLFAGQDYDSNFHFLCFDLKMAKETLERFGFERVSRVSVKPVYSPGELQLEAFKPV